jgi:hypothetical protein
MVMDCLIKLLRLTRPAQEFSVLLQTQQIPLYPPLEKEIEGGCRSNAVFGYPRNGQ